MLPFGSVNIKWSSVSVFYSRCWRCAPIYLLIHYIASQCELHICLKTVLKDQSPALQPCSKTASASTDVAVASAVVSSAQVRHIWILLACCPLSIRLICVNCVFGVLCTLLCWLVALNWCGMGYASGLLKIFWLYMMSVLYIYLDNVSVPSGVVLKMNFYCKLHNTHFILACFYIFCLIVYMLLCLFYSSVMSVLLPYGKIKFTNMPQEVSLILTKLWHKCCWFMLESIMIEYFSVLLLVIPVLPYQHRNLHVLIMTMWLVQWWTLLFLQEYSMLVFSKLNDRRLQDQC